MTSIVSDIPSGYNDVYRYQRQQRARRHTVIGTQAQQSSTFRRAEPSRDIFVYRVVEDNRSGDIKQYMVVNNVDVRSIESVSSDNSTYCSFKVEI